MIITGRFYILLGIYLLIRHVIRRIGFQGFDWLCYDNVGLLRFLVQRYNDFLLGGRLTVGRTFLRRGGGLRASYFRVRLYVFRQVIRTHELLRTFRTLETLLTRVGPTMPLEFVGSGEFFTAKYPGADEGSFASVPA